MSTRPAQTTIKTGIAMSAFIIAFPGCAGSDAPPPETQRSESQQLVEVVGQGVISTDGNETFPAQDPVNGALWFSVYENSFGAQTIMFAERTESGWAPPQVALFSGEWGDRAPRLASRTFHSHTASETPHETPAWSGRSRFLHHRNRDQGRHRV